MAAIGIAFDITIVGALALSWVVLVIDLFFVGKEQRLKDVLKSGAQEIQATVLGVLLFAMAFFLGTGVSRICQDFFNDDDLWVLLRLPGHSITEANIRINTYCDEDERKIVELSLKAVPITKEEFRRLCEDRGSHPTAKLPIDIQGIFRLQESALLLEGEDKTQRLRQYHDQIIVLRGAAFNGLVAFVLCLFGLCAKYRAKVRWVVPLLFLLAGVATFVSHILARLLEPPFMETSLFVLGGAGYYALRKGTERNYWICAVISGLLTLMAFLGWWWTEVLYNQQVFYSFYAQTNNLTK